MLRAVVLLKLFLISLYVTKNGASSDLIPLPDNEEGYRDSYNVTSFSHKLRYSAVVVDIRPGCGRMNNRLLVFSDGSKGCCKYSETELEQRGELFAYHLSSLLHVESVPPAVLATLNFSGSFWRRVSDKAIAAGWRNGKKVLLTSFVENLQDEYFPSYFVENLTTKKQDQLPNTTKQYFSTANKQELAEWSNMIMFDYITGHSDRLLCSLVNMQWAPSVVDKPIHNLGKTATGRLIMYDNESCFAIGYKAGRSYKKKLQTYFVAHLCRVKQSYMLDALSQHAAGNRDLLLEAAKQIAEQSNDLHIHQLSQHDKDEFMRRTTFVLNQFKTCT